MKRAMHQNSPYRPRSRSIYKFFVFLWWHIFLSSSEELPPPQKPVTSFRHACDIHLNSSHGSNYTYKSSEPSSTFPSAAEEGWLHADLKEIRRYYLEAKADCESFLSNYTIDVSHLPDFWPDMKQLDKSGQPKCRGTPQLFQITKGLLAWPFGPYNSCPTYRKCWFGVLTCGQADLQSMRALIHPHVVERIKEIASISGPIIRALLDPLSSSSLANGSMVNRKTKPMKVVDHLKNYSSHVPLMTRWSIRALRLAMRVIGTELVIPEQRLVTLQNVSRSGLRWQYVNMGKGRGLLNIAGEGERRGGGDKELVTEVNSNDNNRLQATHPLIQPDSPALDGKGERVGGGTGANTGSIYASQRKQQPQQQQPRPSATKKQPMSRTRFGLERKRTDVSDIAPYDTSDDVIIAQYTLTHPSSNTRLEIRQEELRLSSLLDWDVAYREALGMDMMLGGSIYVGGTETRCRFFGGDTGCRLPQQMKRCVVQSYVTGTPIVVDAPDGSATQCPAVERRRQGLEPPLPLCSAGTGSNPGRWIQSSALSLHPNRCDPNIDNYAPWPHKYSKIRNSISSNTDANTNVSTSTDTNTNAANTPTSTTATFGKHAFGSTVPWMEASGDPCLIRSKSTDKTENMEEELRAAHWFYAPYQCRYHFYSPSEAARCFQHKSIKNVVMIGDSITRDLFNWLTAFFNGGRNTSTGNNSSSISSPPSSTTVNVSEMSDQVQQARNNLKYATNVLKMKEIHFGGKHTTLPSFRFIQNMDSKKHDLMNDLGIINLKSGTTTRPIDLVITNHAIAHKGPSSWPEFVRHWQSNEALFWQLFHNGTYKRNDGNGHTSGIPRYRIYQGPMAYFGITRYLGNSDESFLRAFKLLRSSLDSLGFSVLSDYLLTDGKFLPNDDGLHFFGTGRQMEVTVLINLLCNDLLE